MSTIKEFAECYERMRQVETPSYRLFTGDGVINSLEDVARANNACNSLNITPKEFLLILQKRHGKTPYLPTLTNPKNIKCIRAAIKERKVEEEQSLNFIPNYITYLMKVWNISQEQATAEVKRMLGCREDD